MICRPNSKLMSGLLITLFLWAQSAVALHDLDHASHESVESCQIFINADHGKAMVADLVGMELPSQITQTYSFCRYSFSKRVVLKASARAPPVS